MASNKKSKYRSLISRLQGIAGSTGSASEAVDKIQPELDNGLLINGRSVDKDVIDSVKDDIESAESSLYRAIRSCYSSMNKKEDDDE